MRKKVSQIRREEMAAVERSHTNGIGTAVLKRLLDEHMLFEVRLFGKFRAARWLVVRVACLRCN